MKIIEFEPERVRDCKVAAMIHATELCFACGRPAIVICPGGGYDHISEREAEPVAQQYFAAGYNVFVLYYSIGKYACNFTPLIQLASTVAHIRKNANQLNVDVTKIAVCGFSAGGHLACSLGTLFNNAEFLKVFDNDAHIRPDALILSYPVITADEYAHQTSIETVSGEQAGSERYRWFDLTNHVDANTPPVFLWHTAKDDQVPVENSLKLAMSLSKAKVSFELHVFPEGDHGMSVCTKSVDSYSKYNQRWLSWSIIWLNTIFDFEN